MTCTFINYIIIFSISWASLSVLLCFYITICLGIRYTCSVAANQCINSTDPPPSSSSLEYVHQLYRTRVLLKIMCTDSHMNTYMEDLQKQPKNQTFSRSFNNNLRMPCWKFIFNFEHMIDKIAVAGTRRVATLMFSARKNNQNKHNSSASNPAGQFSFSFFLH